MPDFLFEILSEEMPASMQLPAAYALGDIARAFMAEHGLASKNLDLFVTPKRLTLFLQEPLQHTTVVERKGPSVSAGDVPFQGFCKTLGITPQDCFQKETPKGTFWMARFTPERGSITDNLIALCRHILETLSWPVSMRWTDTPFTWVRPIRGLVCLYGNDILPWTFDLGSYSLTTGRTTSAHRLAPIPTIDITQPSLYAEQLRRAFVIPCAKQRMQHIKDSVHHLAKEQGCIPFAEDFAQGGLVEETAGLTEWPICLLGSFDEAFLILPEALITTTLRTHQRYFPLRKKDRNLSASFVVVTNMPEPSHAVREGYERVVRARLTDALFFWNNDLSRPLESYNDALKERLFFEGLGTIYDKAKRLQMMAPLMPLVDSEDLKRAALLSKADLATGIVGEFPHLQGIAGCCYAQKQHEKEAVSRALAEHYQAEDLENQTLLGGVLGILDRIDTLVGFFALNRVPSGSKDPMALRRSAFGVIRLLLHHRYPVNLDTLISQSFASYQQQGLLQTVPLDFPHNLLAFLEEKGVALFPEISTYLEATYVPTLSVYAWYVKALALQHLLSTDNGKAFLASYKRLHSLLPKTVSGTPQPDLFTTSQEKALWTMIQTPFPEDPQDHCATWAQTLNAFFDEVRVMDPVLQENRLQLLQATALFFSPLGQLPLVLGTF